MYRLGVASDSHGRTSALKSAAERLSDVDAVVHLGDCETDAIFFKAANRPLYTVSGNCDCFARESPSEIVIDIDGVKLLMCHGHSYCVKYSLTRLSLRAREAGCALVLYGHTHIPSVDTDGGIVFVNPGALMDGRFCVIEFRENGPVPVMYEL